jgi:hypothetical protein
MLALCFQACGEVVQNEPGSGGPRKITLLASWINRSVRIPPQQFNEIAAPAAKDEYMPGKGILFKNRLNRRAQPIKTAAKIRRSRGNPDLRACR